MEGAVQDGAVQGSGERVSPLLSRLTRVRNHSLIPLEIMFGATRVWSRPHEVQFAAEHRCKLRCIMCEATASREAGRPTLMDRRLGTSAAEQFGKITHLLPYLKRIALTGSGEILLCPGLEGILQRLKTHGVEAAFVTNGQLLNREKAELLVVMQVAELVISVDAGCKETYETIRAGASWERLLDGIQTLNAVKAEKGSDRPAITIAGNFMRMNISELPAMVDLAAAHKAAGVWITETIFYDPALADQGLDRCRNWARQLVAEAGARARRQNLAFNNWISGLSEPAPRKAGAVVGRWRRLLRRTRRRLNDSARQTVLLSRLVRSLRHWLFRWSPAGPVVTERLDILNVCRNPWSGLTVWRDGSVRVCCMESVLLGNIDTQSFEEIWNGKVARELRRSFLDSEPPEGCRNCRLVKEGRRQGRLSPGATDIEDVRVPQRDLGPTAEEKICYFLGSPSEAELLSGMSVWIGWIFLPAGVKRLVLLVDGKEAATARTGLHRPDVARRLGTSEALASGFRIRFDASGVEAGWHLAALRVTDGCGRTFDICHRAIRTAAVTGETVAVQATTSPTSTSSSS